jgi:hypothetical protein
LYISPKVVSILDHANNLLNYTFFVQFQRRGCHGEGVGPACCVTGSNPAEEVLRRGEANFYKEQHLIIAKGFQGVYDPPRKAAGQHD